MIWRTFVGLARDARIWLLIGPATSILFLDPPVAKTLWYALIVVFIVVGVAHAIRKLVMPYIDLDSVVARAVETATGAGLVFVGVALLLASIVLAAAQWLGR